MKRLMDSYQSSLCFQWYCFHKLQKDNSNSSNTIQNVIGYAQKGPFINGSSVTVYDLQSNLSPTGKSFNAQIIDNKGHLNLVIYR